MKTFLYSFLTLILFISCGENKTAGEDVKGQEVNSTEQQVTKDPEAETRNILFFGNSLTAGLGVDPDEAFPALIQEKIDSLKLPYQVINAGLSGETTASGRNRVNWVLDENVEIFVLELGANDGLRGIPLQETRRNLQAIIDTVRAKDPEIKIVLAGMQIPPNMGPEYSSEFRSIFPELAEKNNTALVPFLLEGVAGNPELNQPDGIHPTAEGHRIMAENVWEVLKPILTSQKNVQMESSK